MEIPWNIYIPYGIRGEGKLLEIGVFENCYPQFKCKKLLDFLKAELPLLDLPVPENLSEQITMQTKV